MMQLMKIALVSSLIIWVSACATRPVSENPSSISKPAAAKKVSTQTVEAPRSSKPAPAPVQKPKDEGISTSDLAKALKEGNDDEIKKTAGALLNKNPNDVKVLNVIGMHYYKEGKPELAKIYLFRALKVSEKSAETHSNMGVIFWGQGRMREALRSFKRALQLDSSDPYVAANLGQIYAEAKDYRRAKAALDIAYSNDVRPFSVLSAYAVSLHAEGKISKAHDVFEQALKISSNDTKLLTNYAVFLVEGKKDFSEAEEILGKLRFLGVSGEQKALVESLETKVRGGKK